jgi:hypothetical protein
MTPRDRGYLTADVQFVATACHLTRAIFFAAEGLNNQTDIKEINRTCSTQRRPRVERSADVNERPPQRRCGRLAHGGRGLKASTTAAIATAGKVGTQNIEIKYRKPHCSDEGAGG